MPLQFADTNEEFLNKCHTSWAPSVGATVIFEGRVRSINQNREVSHLKYEAFAELSVKQFEALEKTLERDFGILFCKAVHRVGQVSVGMPAVWLAVSSTHREEAFKACEYAMNFLKRELPIWKQEFFSDQTSLWGNNHCECHIHVSEELSYDAIFKPQKQLERVGSQGQSVLKEARVLVVGAGGLGCPVGLYLCASGVGHIAFCDDDLVEENNLARQVLYKPSDIGKKKAYVSKKALKEQFPMLFFEAFDVRLSQENAWDLIEPFDLVLDCTDDFFTKKLLNRVMIEKKRPWVSASVFHNEGEVCAYVPSLERGCFACFRNGDLGIEPACNNGVLSLTCGFVAMMQAHVAVSSLLKESHLCQTLFLLDVFHNRINSIQTKKDVHCTSCAQTLNEPIQENFFLDWPQGAIEEQIKAGQAELLDVSDQSTSLRVSKDLILKKENPLFWSLEQMAQRRHKNWILVCPEGKRSAALCRLLRSQGHDNFFALKRRGVS